ncbi:MAG: hypothetical protein GAK30_01086 [Paracidovorax wautersii]|uniref:Calcineurin-like phosphoesterase n=1 Tax=Paracidovorax wautersii TaxID=1177982 RepID=A0A7V8JQZ3_9BURK|nr:MAG: hypothetical protein GAK30_01086 [Paracidovorax wautersii]
MSFFKPKNHTHSAVGAAILDHGRRQVLARGLGLSVATVGGSSLLAACGGDSSNDTSSGSSSGSSSGGSQPADSTLGSRFALAVLPDTQFYSRYATLDENNQYMRRYGSEPFMAQTYFTASNAEDLNIPFLIHLGDVVDQVRKPDQWKVADQAMRVLETAKVPYSILAGNHDVLDDQDYVDASSQASATDAQRDLRALSSVVWHGPRGAPVDFRRARRDGLS